MAYSPNTGPRQQAKRRLLEITDGTTNTFLLGEKHVPGGRFGRNLYGDSSIYNGSWVIHAGRLAGLNDPLALGPTDESLSISPTPDAVMGRKFGSWHSGVCGFVFCDGSVRFVRNSMDGTTLQRLALFSDGDVVLVPD
jgi:prepilin-type processing-associated H-X9-DG protein